MILLSHRGTKRYTSAVLERARAAGAARRVVRAGGCRGPTSRRSSRRRRRRSRRATPPRCCGWRRWRRRWAPNSARWRPCPDAVAGVSDGEPGVEPPRRLLEFIGAGPNQWTAAEGALKVRETCYVATEGLSAEQLLHGPSWRSASADTLVCLNGGGPGEGRLLEVARSAESRGVTVHTITAAYPYELLSVFPLTAAVQRIALETAEQLGTNPDSFGRDMPVRAAALEGIEL